MELSKEQLNHLLTMLDNLRHYYFADFEKSGKRNQEHIMNMLKEMAMIELLINVELDEEDSE